MIGMDATTGAVLSGTAHLAQSIGDILSTPIGTRVMRRDYGSALAELVDAPAGDMTRLRVFAATAVALQRWEPRIRLTRIGLQLVDASRWSLTIEGERTDDPSPTDLVRLSIPLRLATN